MLTGMHIVVIGGDARQLEVIKKLAELDAMISLIGFEQLDHGFTGAVKKELSEIDFTEVDSIILPVPGTNLEGKVETVFSNEEIMFTEDILMQTPEHCMIFSGISNSYLNDLTSNTKRKLIQLFERDDVAIYNSIPTVEGTIMMVIQNTDITIHGANIVVLGLGRVGMSTARIFHALGANVAVGARKSEHLARATEMGLKPFHLDTLEDAVTDADVVINTIPVQIVTASVISQLPPHALIIDLASKPGGTDFRYAERRGVKALLAPGLPGIVAPKTAGQIVAKVISTLLHEAKQQRKES